MDFFNYKIVEDVFCEVCGSPAVDINHIQCRGTGGNPKGDKDVIENLMAMCRNCHTNFGDVPECKERLKEVHLKMMNDFKLQKNNVGTPIDITR